MKMTFSTSVSVSPSSIILMPVFLARPGQEATLENVLHTLQTLSRADDGCLDYSVYVDKSDSGRFLLHEEWADQTAFDAHNLQGHVTDFIKQTDVLLKEPFTVTWMRAIGS